MVVLSDLLGYCGRFRRHWHTYAFLCFIIHVRNRQHHSIYTSKFTSWRRCNNHSRRSLRSLLSCTSEFIYWRRWNNHSMITNRVQGLSIFGCQYTSPKILTHMVLLYHMAVSVLYIISYNIWTLFLLLSLSHTHTHTPESWKVVWWISGKLIRCWRSRRYYKSRSNWSETSWRLGNDTCCYKKMLRYCRFLWCSGINNLI